MPIQHLNGVQPRPSRLYKNTPYRTPVKPDASDVQHPATGVVGRSYGSPFTESANPPLGTHINTATLPQLPALHVEEAGKVVRLSELERVQPQSKTVLAHPGRSSLAPATKPGAGRPSKQNNVPANPNAKTAPAPRPPRSTDVATEKYTPTTGSFGHLAQQTLTGSQNTDGFSRWHTIKTGAAG